MTRSLLVFSLNIPGYKKSFFFYPIVHDGPSQTINVISTLCL